MSVERILVLIHQFAHLIYHFLKSRVVICLRHCLLHLLHLLLQLLDVFLVIEETCLVILT